MVCNSSMLFYFTWWKECCRVDLAVKARTSHVGLRVKVLPFSSRIRVLVYILNRPVEILQLPTLKTKMSSTDPREAIGSKDLRIRGNRTSLRATLAKAANYDQKSLPSRYLGIPT